MKVQKIHSGYDKKKMHINRSLCFLMGMFCCLIVLFEGRSPAYAQDAKHIILLIADGLEAQQIQATNTYTGTTPPYQSDPEWGHHWMSTFSYGGSYDTTQAWSDFNYVTQGASNSADTATAMYSGSKTIDARISVTHDGSARLYTIGEKAKSLGRAVGAITTVEVSDATPGAFCAHNDARSNRYAIADECFFGDPNTTGTIADDPKYAGGHGPTTPSIDVLIGDRIDGYINAAIRDKLFTESGQPGKHFLVERETGIDGGDALLAAANSASVTRLAGLFDFIYQYDPAYSAENPTLAESTIAALTVLQKNPNGFILMIEGGAIDWAAHENDMDLMIGEMIDFNEAVQTVIDWVDNPDDDIDWTNTLVIVTGDHGCGYLTAGPGIFQNQPLGEVSDTTLALEKIISGSGGRRASWDDIDGDSVIDAGETVYWAWNSDTHTNTLIPLYARGVGADQLATYAIGYDSVRGYYLDNTDVFFVMDNVIGNIPPVANNDPATTLENTPVDINVIANDTDSDGTIDPATVAITGNPTNGSAVAHTDGTVTYTPDNGFDGTDTFTYTVNDNQGATSNQATVTVTVNAGSATKFVAYNDLAWASGQINSNITTYTTGQNGLLKDYATGIDTTVTLTVAGGYIDATTLTQGSNANNGTDAYTVFNGIMNGMGLISYGATNLTFSFTGLDPNLTYEFVLFGNRDNASYTTRMTTTAISDVAYFTNTSTPGTDFSGPSDPSVTIVNGYNTVNGYVARFTNINPGPDGDLLITVSSDDSHFYANALMLKAVQFANIPPVANNDPATTGENTPVDINVIANDTDSDGTIDPATVAITGNPTNGSAVAHTDGTVTYTPDNGFDGTDTFTYTVNDNQGATSNQATVTVTVNAGSATKFVAYNDLAWASGQINSNITTYTTGQNGLLKDYATGIDTTVTLTVAGGYIDATTLTQGSNANNGTDAYTVFNGIMNGMGLISYGATNLTFSFTGLDPNLTYEFVLFGNRDNASYTTRMTTTAISDVAYFTNTSTPGTDFSGPSDPSVTIVNGYNTVNGYVARFTNINPGPDGDLLITVSSDDSHFYANALMLKAVQFANIPPVANNDPATTGENTPVDINVIANDTDSDGTIDPATVAITGNPTNGSAVAHTDGTVTYTPDNGFDGTDTFTYTVNDNQGATSNQATVTVTVNNTFTISASAPVGHGTIFCTSPVIYGDTSTCTITPDAHYHLSALADNSANVLGLVVNNIYTINNVTANHTVVATFSINTYTITASAGANGGISPSGAVIVNHGANQSFTITPNANYHVADVLVDGSSVGAVTSYPFTNVTANHTISASFAINTHTITASAGANGGISPSGAVIVNHGANQSFTITPNANYHVADVLVDGSSVGAVTSYPFTNVTANHTISASFAINTHTITASAGANGGISPSGAVIVNHGANQSFTITPNANYHVADVLVDGSSVGAVTSYPFTNVTANHTISASFAINTHTITASAGANGGISPSGAVIVNHGANQSFTITPNANYHVADVLVDGSSVGAVTSYPFTNVTANHTISASFAINTINTHTITASAGANGGISPSGAVIVNHGANQSFTITPNANYHVADVLVDGSSVGAVTSYPFTNVTANHTISASFAINTHTITASAGANGGISPSGAVIVNHGANQSFTITPNANYHVADVLVDGSSVGAVTSYPFTNVTANHTISASFAINTHTITASAGANGGISPSGAVIVNHGANQSFTITPNANYHVADVLVDGSSVGAVTSYPFTNVTANHTISASFAIDTIQQINYTLSLSGSGSGSVKVNGTTCTPPWSGQFPSGTNVQIEAISDSGWGFTNWTGDYAGSTNPTTVNISSDKNITANFSQNCDYSLTVNINPSGSGTVTKNPDKANYCPNEQVSLTANPNSGNNFSSWGGVDSNSETTASITMNDNRTVTANFNQQTLNEPDISVDPVTQDFGNIPIGELSMPQTLTVSNTGSGDLVIGTLSITGTDASQFIKQNDTCSGQTVTPSANCTVEIAFSPTSMGSFDAILNIPSNDLDDPNVTVSLKGGSGADITGLWMALYQQCNRTKCKVKGKFNVQNLGNKDALSSLLRFYLSDDGVYDGGDIFLKEIKTGKLKVGKSKKKSLSYSFPSGVSATDKYIIAVIDADNTVMEANEINNSIVYGPIQRPDLTGLWTSLIQQCNSSKNGIKCKIRGVLNIQNIGYQDAASLMRFYLSDDGTYDEGDMFLKQVSTGTLKAGKSKKKSLSYSFPSGVSATDKYIIAVIDSENSVLEENEGNNNIIYGPLP